MRIAATFSSGYDGLDAGRTPIILVGKYSITFSYNEIL